MNPVLAYIQSLTSAVKHQTTNSQGNRKPRYAPARSPYEVGFHPSFNENIRGVPPTTPHSTKLFQMSQQPMPQQQSHKQVQSNVNQHPQVQNIASLQTPGRFKPNTPSTTHHHANQ